MVKDLDFDELDKAVNSLMSGASKTPEPTTKPSVAEPVENVVELTPAADPQPQDPAPSPVAQVKPATPAPAPSRPATTVAAPTLPNRRGAGRFMDVVHPSSDMKKPEAPQAPSRRGVTIAPRPAFEASQSAPEPAKTPDEPEAPKTEVAEAPTPSPWVLPGDATPEEKKEPVAAAPKTEEHPAAVSDFPDPLDVAGFSHEPEEKTESDAPKEEAPQPEMKEEEEQPAPAATPEPTPLTSPFLPDAKVEKRPLGGAPTEEPDHAPVLADADEKKTVDDPNAQLPAVPQDVEQPLPAEFHSDLVAVEADTTTPETPQKKESEEKPAEKPETAKAAPTPAVSSPVPDKKDEQPAPSGPASIPQQYKEEPSSGDKENGAIYDTDTYHQPLAHPAKKKSGWLWVVWIVLILLLGAGGGAALYFSGIL